MIITYRTVRACMWVPGRVGVCMGIRACNLANPFSGSRFVPYGQMDMKLSVPFLSFANSPKMERVDTKK
jgi:hypothetical protein